MSRVQNELIGHGWVTSRELAPEQDLRSGMLVLIPGKIRHVIYSDDADKHAVLLSAMPARTATCSICAISNRGWKTCSACRWLRQIWKLRQPSGLERAIS